MHPGAGWQAEPCHSSNPFRQQNGPRGPVYSRTRRFSGLGYIHSDEHAEIPRHDRVSKGAPLMIQENRQETFPFELRLPPEQVASPVREAFCQAWHSVCTFLLPD